MSDNEWWLAFEYDTDMMPFAFQDKKEAEEEIERKLHLNQGARVEGPFVSKEEYEKRISDQRKANATQQKIVDRYRTALQAIEKRAGNTGNECLDEDPDMRWIRKTAYEALTPKR